MSVNAFGHVGTVPPMHRSSRLLFFLCIYLLWFLWVWVAVGAVFFVCLVLQEKGLWSAECEEHMFHVVVGRACMPWVLTRTQLQLQQRKFLWILCPMFTWLVSPTENHKLSVIVFLKERL